MRAVVYSHGHVGYNSGVAEWNAHCEERGYDVRYVFEDDERPVVVR